MTTTATVGYLTVHHEVNNFGRRPDPVRRRATGYQQQAGPRSAEYTDYRREAGPFVPGPAPAAEWFEDDRSEDGDPLWMAGQVLTLADDKAAQVAQEAQADATSIREAAQREANAVREAAAREAAEVRARLDTLTGELGRVLAKYVSEALANPAAPATAPAQPRAEPALPGAGPALLGAASAPPATKPARPDTRPDSRPPGSAKPRTTPAGPETAPANKAQKKPGRQKNAMRIAKLSTAALLVLALGASAAEIGQHGYKFFVFRENGQGQSPGGPTDSQFLAQQAKAAQHSAAPKGRHHKPAPRTAKSTTNG